MPGPGSRDDVAKATQALADALAALIATAPHDWHMLQRVGPRTCGVGPDRGGGAVRVGIVCPYSLDVPGGVQSHVLDLARALIALGHSVSVLAPADDERADGDPRCRCSSHPPGAR